MDANGGVNVMYFQGANSNNSGGFDNEILEFNNGVTRKGRGSRKSRTFPTERERRVHLNDCFLDLKNLIPNPTKNDRESIVQDGIVYINELRRLVSELKSLVEKKRCGGRHKNIDSRNTIYVTSEIEHPFSKMRLNHDDKNMEKKPESDVIDHCSWLERKSKVIEVYVRVLDDEVTIKVVQKKKIVNCLFFVSKVLDQFHLVIHHVAGGHFGEHYSFLLKTKIHEGEGSTINASAIANRVIEFVDKQYYMAALPSFNQ